MVELLKQEQYVPMPVEKQTMIIFAGINGYLDEVAVSDVKRFEREFFVFMHERFHAMVKELVEKRELTDALSTQLHAALKAFKNSVWPTLTGVTN